MTDMTGVVVEDQILRNMEDHKYDNRLGFSFRKDQHSYEAWKLAGEQAMSSLRFDLEQEAGMFMHPKAELLWTLASNLSGGAIGGHLFVRVEVYRQLAELAK